jgi:hypothetical protein
VRLALNVPEQGNLSRSVQWVAYRAGADVSASVLHQTLRNRPDRIGWARASAPHFTTPPSGNNSTSPSNPYFP